MQLSHQLKALYKHVRTSGQQRQLNLSFIKVEYRAALNYFFFQVKVKKTKLPVSQSQ